ncbi:GGDEF domain-containing protein [Vibrio sp. WXL103]|uniref:GGDEF domain-containing protein n=1 Tax=unclassified Vibrio TaxID=2614977 RepID=UPI003EC838D4
MEPNVSKFADQTKHQILVVSCLCFGLVFPFFALMNLTLATNSFLGFTQLGFVGYCFYIFNHRKQHDLHRQHATFFSYCTIAVACMTSRMLPFSVGSVVWVLVAPVLLYALLGVKHGFFATLVTLILNCALSYTPFIAIEGIGYQTAGNMILGYAAIWALLHSHELNRNKTAISLHNLAVKDALTGCYNRLALSHDYEHLASSTDPVSILILDIDHFKRVNDEYGHVCGDKVLQEIGGLLTRYADNDVYRIGGEEFCIPLPNTSMTEAAETAETIRHYIDKHVFNVDGNKLHVTMSIGVCLSNQQPLDEVLAIADAELYRAKQNGRNQVKVCHCSQSKHDFKRMVI